MKCMKVDKAPFKSKANEKQYCFNETVKDNIQETQAAYVFSSNLLTMIWGDSYLLGVCLQTCVLGLVFNSRVIECVDTDILKSLQSGIAID